MNNHKEVNQNDSIVSRALDQELSILGKSQT